MSEYGMGELLDEFGLRWQIVYIKYLDGWQFSAVPKPADSSVLPLVRPTPVLMAACLREAEMAALGRRLVGTAREDGISATAREA